VCWSVLHGSLGHLPSSPYGSLGDQPLLPTIVFSPQPAAGLPKPVATILMSLSHKNRRVICDRGGSWRRLRREGIVGSPEPMADHHHRPWPSPGALRPQLRMEDYRVFPALGGWSIYEKSAFRTGHCKADRHGRGHRDGGPRPTRPHTASKPAPAASFFSIGGATSLGIALTRGGYKTIRKPRI